MCQTAPQFLGGSGAGLRLSHSRGCCGERWAWSPRRDTGQSWPHGCIPRQESERAASGQHQNREFLERLGSGAGNELSPAPILGMGSAMGTWLLLLVLLAVAPAQAAAPRHRPVLPDTAGSGDGDEASATLPAQPVTPRVSPTVGDAPGTTVTNSSAPGVLDGLVDFFKEYLLLVVVVGSLSFVLLFIICAAVIVRQKHKASAYYPSSFPKKKYVDERDKSGGARVFSEVPEKAPEAGAEEPLDGSRQLQADILAAAQNLKSPHKAPLANEARDEQNSPQEKEEEEEEEGRKKLGDEQPKLPAQNPGAEEAASAGSKETPDASQDGSQAPSGI
ncbi:PREDICTED: transmembrane protein 119 isoform X1 [Pseudopodoces humilis]|uniref:transmembrane protein 119 isoform X1 n=1 Tax=Pseudopodoces humilis TaxID=181119 RepID=UPI0006B70562|nr:PREDICTED: transmembrane protein 119 isoform X1 [Pseudopodoces humilis]